MIVQLPPEPPYGAAYLNGWTRAVSDGPETRRGVVVVKGAYDLVDDGTGPRRMVPSTEPGRAAVVFADQGTALPDDEGFDLTYEADIALEKARVDIVVEGHVAGATGGAVTVDGEVWIRRGHLAGASNDTGRNLFGWLAKTEDQRRIDVGGFPDDAPAEQNLPEEYDARFNNVHRRGAPFSTPGNHIAGPLPATATVEIFQAPDPGEGDTGYAFTLPALAFAARLRAYCGHGPDQARYWRVVRDDVPLVLDTLVVAPDVDRAILLWRGGWPYESVPADAWRKVQILQGSG